MTDAEKAASPAFQQLQGWLALEKLGPYFLNKPEEERVRHAIRHADSITDKDRLQSIVDDERNETCVRLEALSRLKELEINEMNAAIPEPAPIQNNPLHPAIADVVAAELISENAPRVARDVMDRKAFGMKKYGTPLQPFNGRDTLNDLYQELVDAMKYARVYLYECQYRKDASNEADAEDAYEALKELCISIKNTMEEKNGAANNPSNAPCF
jgi:hypothetical protein